MNILITGAGGFIGTHLAHHVQATYPNAKLYTCGLGESSLPGYQLCDLTERSAVEELIQRTRPNRVYHLAGISRVIESYGMEPYLKQNFMTTIYVAESLLHLGQPCTLFFASSVHVYGNQDDLAVESLPPKPGSTYAFTKYLAEAGLRALCQESSQLKVVVGRLYSCFGPGQSEGFVTADFCKKIRVLPEDNSEPLKVGPLSPFRRFLDVRDLVALLPKLLETVPDSPFEIYNIASPHEHTVREILETMLRLAGKNPRIESSQATDNKFAGLKLSMEKLTRALPGLKFRPTEETLRDMLNFNPKQ